MENDLRVIKSRRLDMFARRALIVVPLASLIGVWLSSAASATFPGHNGRIAYTKNGLANIATMNADGSGKKQLTHFPSGTTEYPRYSSDGKQIVFDASLPTHPTASYDIYMMSADGSHLKRLTSDTSSYDDWGACFSPNGKQIAFISNRSGMFQVWMMGANGSGPTQVTTLGGTDYTSWSPNGRWILFDSGGEIYKIHPNGTGQMQLTTFPLVGSAADWSPSGKQIAFSGTNTGGIHQVWIMNADGSSPHAITSDPSDISEPVWSPDGRWIAFDRYVSSVDQVFIVKRGGTGQKQLTSGLGGGEPGWQPLV